MKITNESLKFWEKKLSSRKTIKQQIETTVAGKYADWQIGATDSPQTSKAQVGNPLSWLHWKVDSIKSALEILKHFQSKGMKPASISAEESGKYVYIYLI